MRETIPVGAGSRGEIACDRTVPAAAIGPSPRLSQEFGNFADLRNLCDPGRQKGYSAGAAPARSCPSIPSASCDTRSQVLRPARLVRVAQQDRQGWQPHPHVRRTPAEQLELVRIMPQPRGKDAAR